MTMQDVFVDRGGGVAKELLVRGHFLFFLTYRLKLQSVIVINTIKYILVEFESIEFKIQIVFKSLSL